MNNLHFYHGEGGPWRVRQIGCSPAGEGFSCCSRIVVGGGIAARVGTLPWGDWTMKLLKLAFVSALFGSLPTPALAWGQTGHRVIGEIAQHRVSGRTAAEVALLLGPEGLAEASTFADEQRSNPAVFWQTEAGPYHFVTVPAGKSYAEVEAPPEGDAITALKRFSATVRDPNASKEDRATALRFIIHIVGDLHQPLHAGNGTDKGGNDVSVRWFGAATNLHSVWDTELIESRNLSYTEYAARLETRITPQETIDWWTADSLVWIGESTRLRDTVYPEGDNPALSYRYVFDHIDEAELRLEQGGVRLAAYLDALFAS